MRTSFSSLETFQQCPQKYKFEAIDKIRTSKSKEAIFGTLVHNSLKYLFSHDPLYPSLDEIIAYFRTAWTSAEIAEISKDERVMYLAQGEAILRRFYAKNQPWNFNVIDTESRFDIQIEDPKSGEVHTIVGIMDRIDKPTDTTYEILDYKTSRKMKSQEALDADLQLSLYHMGLMRRWPHITPDSIALSLYYVKHNEKLTTTRTKEHTEEIKQNVLTTIRDIKNRTTTDDFPPQPSILCDWCGYKAMCPAWKFLYTKKAVVEPPIEETLKEFFTLKKQGTESAKRIAELQAHIKTYMEQEGVTRVFSTDGIVAKKLQERFAYNFEKVKEILTAHNRLDIWELLLSPDEKILKKKIKELPTPIQIDIESARELAKQFDMLTVSTKVEDVEINEVEPR
jgi:putative RecB family exonuclease